MVDLMLYSFCDRNIDSSTYNIETFEDIFPSALSRFSTDNRRQVMR